MSVKYRWYYLVEGCNGSNVFGEVEAKSFKKALKKAEKVAEWIGPAWMVKLEVIGE